MKEFPILFNGDMVRAILDGRKTQTRRAFSTQMIDLMYVAAHAGEVSYFIEQGFMSPNDMNYVLDFCHFGKVGDQLWVRETWGNVSYSFDDDGFSKEWIPTRPAKAINEMPFGGGYYDGHVIYRADGEFEWCGDDDGGGKPRSAWHPSIHMPRQASRIQLEITGIRVERLQDISENDAVAEGIQISSSLRKSETCYGIYECKLYDGKTHFSDSAYDLFKNLWNSTGGDWNKNPWVWVIEFKRVEVTV